MNIFKKVKNKLNNKKLLIIYLNYVTTELQTDTEQKCGAKEKQLCRLKKGYEVFDEKKITVNLRKEKQL